MDKMEEVLLKTVQHLVSLWLKIYAANKLSDSVCKRKQKVGCDAIIEQTCPY